MLDDFILTLLFSLALMCFGVGMVVVVYAPQSEKVEAIVNLPGTVQSLFAILNPISGQNRVIDATEMSYNLRMPCRSGWFWCNGVPKKSSLFFACVPLGFVAKLPGVDSVSGRQFTDTSSLCLVNDMAGSEVGTSPDGAGHTNIDLLQRCRRWQILIQDLEGQNIKTKHDILIRAHVAVHTSIEIDVSNPNMNIVFSDHLNYLKVVESHVIRTLRRLAGAGDYSKLVTDVLEITKELNLTWGALLTNDEAPSPSCLLVTTFFSGVVLKMYVEQEEARLQPVLAYFSNIERKFSDAKSDFDTWKSQLKSMLIDSLNTLDKSLEELTGFGNYDVATSSFSILPNKGLELQVKSILEISAKRMGLNMKTDMNASAGSIISPVKINMDSKIKKVLSDAEEFAKAIKHLKTEELKCEQDAQSNFSAGARP